MLGLKVGHQKELCGATPHPLQSSTIIHSWMVWYTFIYSLGKVHMYSTFVRVCGCCLGGLLCAMLDASINKLVHKYCPFGCHVYEDVDDDNTTTKQHPEHNWTTLYQPPTTAYNMVAVDTYGDEYLCSQGSPGPHCLYILREQCRWRSGSTNSNPNYHFKAYVGGLSNLELYLGNPFLEDPFMFIIILFI